MNDQTDILQELEKEFGQATFTAQTTRDEIPTVWAPRDKLHDVLRFLKHKVARPYRMLYDLTAIDERVRANRNGQPDSDFTVVYHLLSYERNEDVRLKVALKGDRPNVPSITSIWPSANWLFWRAARRPLSQWHFTWLRILPPC